MDRSARGLVQANASFAAGVLGFALMPIDMAGDGLLVAFAASDGEIAGAGAAFEGERTPPFNPSNGRTHCVNGVCAFFKSVKGGKLVTASEDVAWNGGRIEAANQQIEEAVDLTVGSGQNDNALNTARPRQFFIVYPGSSARVTSHVMVGINNGGKLLLYDPQTGRDLGTLPHLEGLLSCDPVGARHADTRRAGSAPCSVVLPRRGG